MKRQVVVITGASAGVGRATVRAFARQGADIGLIARGKDGLKAARREVEAAGGRVLVLPLDVADAAEVEAATAGIEKKLGPIDVWINNAMVSVFSPALEMTPEEFRRVTEVTYLGAVHGTLAALRQMKKRNRGVIVQVGSALAYRSIPLQSAYCAAKHGAVGHRGQREDRLAGDAQPAPVEDVGGGQPAQDGERQCRDRERATHREVAPEEVREKQTDTARADLRDSQRADQPGAGCAVSEMGRGGQRIGAGQDQPGEGHGDPDPAGGEAGDEATEGEVQPVDLGHGRPAGEQGAPKRARAANTVIAAIVCVAGKTGTRPMVRPREYCGSRAPRRRRRRRASRS